MPESDDENDDLPASAFSIGHDGKIDGIYRPKDQRQAPAFLREPEGPLELMEPEPVIEALAVPDEPEPRPTGVAGAMRTAALVFAAVVMLALLASGYFLWHRLRSGGPAPARAAVAEPARVVEQAVAEGQGVNQGVLTVDSAPAGATVFIDGEDVGRTPYLGTNGFARRTAVRIRLTRKGYRPWTSTFAGGVDAKVNALLQPMP